MPPVGFEPAISASDRPQTYALDRAANGIGKLSCLQIIILGTVDMALPNNTYLALLFFYIRNCLLVYVIKIREEMESYMNVFKYQVSRQFNTPGTKL
jgi:hypothetical protein